MRRNVLLDPSPREVLLELLLVLLLGPRVLAVCPSVCSCSPSHREVDCSRRGLRHLPHGLQHNLRSLNLSHNRLHGLDGRLTAYAHLRVLDLSHNRLGQLPAGLPRSLWQLHASANRIRLLDKNDTAYQWNLRLLELSNNKLERAVFINNTLTNLRTLNLSHNRFWTAPTNMPTRLETADLSHNSLVQVLPGSLSRLSQLAHFYLHANRFSTLLPGALDGLLGLRVITLGDNPWACHLQANVTYLLSWIQHTPARVLGCPCHTQPLCGEARPGRTGGWHFASYNLPPLAANAQDLSSARPPEVSTTGWWYLSVSGLLSTQYDAGGSLDAQHRPYPAATQLIPTLPLSTTNADLITERRSTTVNPSAVDHLSLTGPHSITGAVAAADKAPTADSLDTTRASPVTDAPITLATDRFFTTGSISVGTKKTTTLRTRSVRRPNQSLPGEARNASPALAANYSLGFIQNLWLLTLALQQVL
ncbi:oligodendrocyte-myelin glycoprotein-like [Polymixia lowei]